ncbi:hypothetical protein N431DRAFT_434427, partial [Stipitochalara longipes BDJ]
MAELPSTLYRIQYISTQTQLDASGLHARYQFPVRWDETLTFILAHLDWYNREPSPFISLFSDLTHAERWARNWRRNHPELAHYEIGILRIDSRILMTENVF